MRSQDRRESIIAAATEVFGRYGFVGATTDQVAQAAGVSQPYVVRMFGSKQRLFLDVLDRDVTLLLATLREAIHHDSEVPISCRLELAYRGLLADRGLLSSLMHAFVLGADPVIGPVARSSFIAVHTFLRTEAGLSIDEAQAFLAAGMMTNTMIGIRMADEYESNTAARELLEGAFSDSLEYALAANGTGGGEA